MTEQRLQWLETIRQAAQDVVDQYDEIQRPEKQNDAQENEKFYNVVRQLRIALDQTKSLE